MIRRAVRLSIMQAQHAVPNLLDANLDLAKEVICNITNFDCLDRKCSNCSADKLLRIHLGQWMNDDDHKPIKYKKWSRVTEEVNGKFITKIAKTDVVGHRWEIFIDLCKQLSVFPLHIYNAISQLSAYRKCKESLRSHQVAVVCDFAENFICRQFSEAQSAYYSRNSITIHPMVIIFSKDSDLSRDSVAIISNDLRHDGAAVKSYLEIFSSHLSIHYPSITELVIWSDGCSAQ